MDGDELHSWLNVLKYRYADEVCATCKENRVMAKANQLLRKNGLDPSIASNNVNKYPGVHISSIIVSPKMAGNINKSEIKYVISPRGSTHYRDVSAQLNSKQLNTDHSHNNNKSNDNLFKKCDNNTVKHKNISDKSVTKGIRNNLEGKYDEYHELVQTEQKKEAEKHKEWRIKQEEGSQRNNEIRYTVIADYVSNESERKKKNKEKDLGNVLSKSLNNTYSPSTNITSCQRDSRNSFNLPKSTERCSPGLKLGAVTSTPLTQKEEHLFQSSDLSSNELVEFSENIHELLNFKKELSFFVWLKRTRDITNKRRVLEESFGKRRKIHFFRIWRDGLPLQIKKNRCKDILKKNLDIARIRRNEHIADKFYSRILYNRYFDEWIKELQRSRLQRKKSKVVEEIPVYRRPPDIVFHPVPAKQVRADKKAIELINRTNKSKKEKLNEIKKEMKKDIMKQKADITLAEKEKEKQRRQHLKILMSQHFDRQNAQQEFDHQVKQYNEKLALKRRLEELTVKAVLFRKESIIKRWQKIFLVRDIQSRLAEQHYTKYFIGRFFKRFTNLLEEKEHLKEIKAQNTYKKLLQRRFFKAFNIIRLHKQEIIKPLQQKIKYNILSKFIYEWMLLTIELNRERNAKCIAFYENSLLNKGFRGLSIGSRLISEEEQRIRRRESLTRRALRYLQEARLNVTSEHKFLKESPIDDLIHQQILENTTVFPDEQVIQSVSDESSDDLF